MLLCRRTGSGEVVTFSEESEHLIIINNENADQKLMATPLKVSD
jgi:hypothetical protein